MLATEKGTSLENKVDQILDMMRVLNARQLNFAQRLNQITALVSNRTEQAPPAESKATKAPAEEEPANPATIPESMETRTQTGMESLLLPTEHLRKETSTQTTLPNLPAALENDSTALVNQLIPFDKEIVDVVAKKCIDSNLNKSESVELADTIIQKAINDPECSIACAALSRKLRDWVYMFEPSLKESCSKKFDFFNWKSNKTSCKDNDNNSLRAKLRTKLASLPEGEDEKIVKMKQMRLYRFFGHLFLQDMMLSYKFMHQVFYHLLQRRGDIYIETLCALLSSIGKQYSIQISRCDEPDYELDPIMEELYELVESNDGNATIDQKLSPKCVNSMLLVLKKWSNDWN